MKISSYQQGQPCWIELASTDAASARHFYAALFDWGLNDMPIPEGVYTMFTIDGDDIGAMYQMPPEMSEQGTPTHWGVYFAVDDVQSSAKLVAQQGGKIVMCLMMLAMLAAWRCAKTRKGRTFHFGKPSNILVRRVRMRLIPCAGLN